MRSTLTLCSLRHAFNAHTMFTDTCVQCSHNVHWHMRSMLTLCSLRHAFIAHTTLRLTHAFNAHTMFTDTCVQCSHNVHWHMRSMLTQCWHAYNAHTMFTDTCVQCSHNVDWHMRSMLTLCWLPHAFNGKKFMAFQMISFSNRTLCKHTTCVAKMDNRLTAKNDQSDLCIATQNDGHTEFILSRHRHRLGILSKMYRASMGLCCLLLLLHLAVSCITGWVTKTRMGIQTCEPC